MKKYLLLLSLTLAIYACNTNTNAEKSEEDIKRFTEFSFKVLGLNDSIIADSIWKMIFTLEGIDQLNINKQDSIIMFKVDKNLVESEILAKEITDRGGVIIN